MHHRMWLAVVLVGLCWACSGGRVVESTPAPQPVEKKPDPRLVSNDPFDKRLDHFETTYRELVCRANINYDPMASMGMLIEPWDQMVKFEAEESMSLDPYLDILNRNGYESMAAFAADRERIDKAKRGWWDQLVGQLYDLVQECQAEEP